MSGLRALAPRDRRALVVGGAVVLWALMASFVLRPSLARRALVTDQIAAEDALLAREQAALAAVTVAAGMQGPRDAEARDPAARLFFGKDDIVATSALAEHVEAFAAQHDVWLQLVSSRAAEAGAAQLRTLRVDVRAESDVAGLVGFLEALEHGRRLVRVEQLELAPSGAASDDGTAPLLMTATLLAYATTPEASTMTTAGARVATAFRTPTVDAVAVLTRDPFSPTRRAPAVRYQPPGAVADFVEGGSDAARAGEAPPSQGLPVVHGTAVDAMGAGFAMCALDGGPVVVLRTGDALGPYTVLSIERARVLFRDPSGRRHIIDAMASPEENVR
jgi:type II secretory pathway component PulM